MQPALIVVPYAHSGKLYDAYKDAFNRVGENDWVCFLDADVAFLETSDIGHVLGEYIEKYPDTGIFTCYASRCHYECQRRKKYDMANPDIAYWAKATLETKKELHLQVTPIKRRIAGHLIMMQKSTWTKILPRLDRKLKQQPKKILGFDTKLSWAVLISGFDIKLMQGVLVFHYLRMLSGKNDKIA